MNMVKAYLSHNWQRLSLEQFGSPHNLACVMATPRFRSSSHVVFHVLVAGLDDPVLVVKLPRLPGDDQRLTREAGNLQLVHCAQPGGFDSIPRLVAFEPFRDNLMLIQTALPGPTLSYRLRSGPIDAALDVVGDWLIELHQVTGERSQTVTGWYSRLIEYPLHQFVRAMPATDEELRLVEQTRALAASLCERELPLVFEHRDLGPPNILFGKKGKLGVVDWELAEPSGLPAVDLFFFLTLVRFIQRRARRPAEYVAAFDESFFGPAAWARPYIARYADGLGLRGDDLVPLFALCWSQYVAGLVMRLHDRKDIDAQLDSRTADWLRANRYYALWRHTLAHLDSLNLS